MKVANKVAIITGGGSGLGKASCIHMASHGATVVVADINQEAAEKTADDIIKSGGKALATTMDITQIKDIDAVIKLTLETFGKVDVLVNNAGITGELKPTAKVSVESWDRVINVNLKSVFLFCRQIIPHMLEANGGVIINIASTAGLIATSAGIEYTAAKHGVVGITKEIAFEYGHAGIRSVAIAPGATWTPMVAAIPKEFLESNSDYKKTMNAPAGRYGKPEEIAAMVTFLASDEAAFIQGNTIAVDGGFTSI
ncbi:MAG: glucose 1-dehydrogenase [Spongiibacteraceae bacterium]